MFYNFKTLFFSHSSVSPGERGVSFCFFVRFLFSSHLGYVNTRQPLIIVLELLLSCIFYSCRMYFSKLMQHTAGSFSLFITALWQTQVLLVKVSKLIRHPCARNSLKSLRIPGRIFWSPWLYFQVCIVISRSATLWHV